MRDNRGFTLTELIVTLAILAIMAALAAPNMERWIDKQRLNSVTRQVAAHFNLARSQAIRVNENVNITFTGNSYTITGQTSGTVYVPQTTLHNNITMSVSPSGTAGFTPRGLATRQVAVTLSNANLHAPNNTRTITVHLGGGVMITP